MRGPIKAGRAGAGHAKNAAMLTRASIVLLVVLNLGVASWWALRPAPAAPGATSVSNAPALRLLGEVPVRARVEPIASIAAPATQATVPGPTAVAHCVTFGPFNDAAALAHATDWLQPQVRKLQVREASAGSRGWRVWLPPLADRDTAQATATRIAAAGFSDYYIVPTGDEANSIALGRYGNAQAAQQHAAALQAAGFEARAEALGATVHWIDVEAAATLDPAVARAQTRAPQSRMLECANPG
jgi:hypothetical protein